MSLHDKRMPYMNSFFRYNGITVLVFISFLTILLFSYTKAKACDVAVVSAAASSTGRPAIWKSRDNAESYREQVQYFASVNPSAGGSLRIMGEMAANSGPICSAGVNEAGFAICNTTVYESDPRELVNKNTDMMVDALEQCVTLDDFEDIVNDWADTTLSGNFAVMDAHGGVALYEIWTDGGGRGSDPWQRFNAAASGFVNRTNSHQWKQQTSDTAREIRGRQLFNALYSGNIGTVLGSHKDRLGALIYDDINNISLSYRTVMQLIAKDVCYGDCTTYDDLGVDPGCTWSNCGSGFWGKYSEVANNCNSDLDDSSKYQTRFCISRYQTQFSFVVEGVNNGQDPALVTAWICLGEPSFSVSTPHFAAAHQVTPYAVDDQYYSGGTWTTATGSNVWNGSDATRSSDEYSFLNLAFDWLAYPNSEFLYSNNGFNLLDYGGSSMTYYTDRTMKFSNLTPTQNWTIPIETYLIEKYESFKTYLLAHSDEVTPDNLYGFSNECAKYAYKNYIHRSSTWYSWNYEWDNDDLPPSVVTVSPVENAVDVSLNSVITAKFSEAINESTLTSSTFTVNDGAGNIGGLISYDSPSLTATFIPTAKLCYSDVYTATVTTGIEDLSFNEMNSAKNWSFTTKPLIISVNPPDSSAPVNSPAQITITFNSSVSINSGTVNASNITLRNNTTSANVTASSVTYSSGSAVFTPNAALNAGSYTCTVGTGVKDTGGSGLKNAYSWTFVVNADTTPPVVLSTSVYNGQPNVPVLLSFTATFNEPMDADTIDASNIALHNEDAEEYISGTVSYNALTKTAAFDPDASLDYDTNYTLRISTGVQDISGNSLLIEKVVAFTTKGDTDPPTVISGPPSGLIPIPSVIKVVFDEALDPGTVNTGTVQLYNNTTLQFVSGEVIYDESTNTIKFIPDEPLDPNTEYTFIIRDDVTDINGTHISYQLDWTFTTVPDNHQNTDDDDDTDGEVLQQYDAGTGGCGCGTVANASTLGGYAPLANVANVFANMLLPFILLFLKRLIARKKEDFKSDIK